VHGATARKHVNLPDVLAGDKFHDIVRELNRRSHIMTHAISDFSKWRLVPPARLHVHRCAL
jgi:hypothetical protein